MKYFFLLFIPLIVSACFIPRENHHREYEKGIKTVSKALDDKYVYIPSGSFLLDNKVFSIQSFFISKGEVTNGEYQLFLNDLKTAGQLEKWKTAQIDTLQWNLHGSLEPMTSYYHDHPAYVNYPVVNISYEAALLYCEWMTEKIRKKTGNETLKFRLPTREEFVRAARGDLAACVYSWSGNSLHNEKGLIRCNHLAYGNENIHYNPETKQYEVIRTEETISNSLLNADLTAPSISFEANGYGIYNMNGNVSEMLSEKGTAAGGDWLSPGYDVRNESTKNYAGADPTVGFRPVLTFFGTSAVKGAKGKRNEQKEDIRPDIILH